MQWGISFWKLPCLLTTIFVPPVKCSSILIAYSLISPSCRVSHQSRYCKGLYSSICSDLTEIMWQFWISVVLQEFICLSVSGAVLPVWWLDSYNMCGIEILHKHMHPDMQMLFRAVHHMVYIEHVEAYHSCVLSMLELTLHNQTGADSLTHKPSEMRTYSGSCMAVPGKAVVCWIEVYLAKSH
jgi:hypothetical protein